MEKICTRFFTDPGHGWLRVRKEWIDTLGLDSRISQFSYVDSTYVYLEEDCDASLFEEVAKSKGYGVEVIAPVLYEEESRVRKMLRFRPRRSVY